MGKKLSDQDQAQLAVRVTPALKREVEAILRGYSDRDLQITASDVLLAALNDWMESNDARRFEVLKLRLGADAMLAFTRWQARQPAPVAASEMAEMDEVSEEVLGEAP